MARDERDDTGVEADVSLDAATSAALIAEQRARVASKTTVDATFLFTAWGVAWLVGFGLLWAAERDLLPMEREAAPPVFLALLMGAGVLTAVHVGRRTAGVHGTSAGQRAMYGWTWVAAFAVFVALDVALARTGASPAVLAVVGAAVPPLIVGVLYMAGGAIWSDRTQFTLGGWICAVTVVAAAVGWPHMLAVMALAGGGGMIAAALVAQRDRRGDGRSVR